MEEKKNHKLVMENRERLCLWGVEDVESFDDDKIVAYTTEGILTVEGTGLKINRLCIEDGELEIFGRAHSLVFRDGGRAEGGFFGKLFK